MKKIYSLPIRLEIDAEAPDRYARETAERIYDAVREYVNGPEGEGVTWLNMSYSVFVRADPETFGKE